MKNEQKNIEKATRRFCEKVDGPSVRLLYARTQTAELALELGLTVKQIENYVYRHNFEPWARKDPAFLSMENSKNGKRGGRPKKKISAKKANTFSVLENLNTFAAENGKFIFRDPRKPENSPSADFRDSRKPENSPSADFRGSRKPENSPSADFRDSRKPENSPSADLREVR